MNECLKLINSINFPTKDGKNQPDLFIIQKLINQISYQKMDEYNQKYLLYENL